MDETMRALNDRIAEEFSRLGVVDYYDEQGSPVLYVALHEGHLVLCDANSRVDTVPTDFTADGIEKAAREWIDAVRA